MPKCQVTGSVTTRGNNVPKSNKKTRRTIKNSVKTRRYYSKILNNFVSIKCTTRADSTIIKAGGIDFYVINSKPSKLEDFMLVLRKKFEKTMEKKNLSKDLDDLNFA